MNSRNQLRIALVFLVSLFLCCTVVPAGATKWFINNSCDHTIVVHAERMGLCTAFYQAVGAGGHNEGDDVWCIWTRVWATHDCTGFSNCTEVISVVPVYPHPQLGLQAGTEYHLNFGGNVCKRLVSHPPVGRAILRPARRVSG